MKFSGPDIDDSEMQTEVETCEDYMDKIRKCLALLDKLNSNVNVPDRSRDNFNTLLKQPVAPLPKFSGEENEDLNKFLTEFEVTTASYNYPERDLFLLLVQQVSGRAKVLISSLEADKKSYAEAKKLLNSAFASPETLKFNCIRKLTQLALGYGDDPFEFVSKVKMLTESVKSLEIKSEDFLQYFVWQGLNQDFRDQLTQITTKTRPNFKEIMDNYFAANERYGTCVKQKTLKSTKTDKHTISNLGIAVKTESKPNQVGCSLCSDSDDKTHKIFLCKKFKTPAEKIKKLQSLNGCTSCSKRPHCKVLQV